MSNTWRQSTWTSAVISKKPRMSRRFTLATLDPLNKNPVLFFFWVGEKSPWKSGHRLHPRNLNSYVWKEIYVFQPSFSVSLFFFAGCVFCVAYEVTIYLPTNPYVPMSDPKEVPFLWQVSWSGSLVLLKDQGGREVDVLLLSMEKKKNQTITQHVWNNVNNLGGGFKYVSFSPLFGEDSHFDYIIFFQMGWNHQLVINGINCYLSTGAGLPPSTCIGSFLNPPFVKAFLGSEGKGLKVVREYPPNSLKTGMWVFLGSYISTKVKFYHESKEYSDTETWSISLRLRFSKFGRENHICTPLKIDMEPTTHQIEKKKHLQNLHFWVPC